MSATITPNLVNLKATTRLNDEFPYFPQIQNVKGPNVFVLYEYKGCIYGLMGEAHQSWSFSKKDGETDEEWEARKEQELLELENFRSTEDSVTVFLVNLFLAWEKSEVDADFYLESEYEKDYPSEMVPFNASATNRPNSLDQLRLNIEEDILDADLPTKDPRLMHVHYHLCDIRSFRRKDAGALASAGGPPAFHWGKRYKSFPGLGPGTPLGLGDTIVGHYRSLFAQLIPMVEEMGQLRGEPIQKRSKRTNKPGPAEGNYQTAYFIVELVVALTYVDFCFFNVLEIFDILTSRHEDVSRALDRLYATFDSWLVGSKTLFYEGDDISEEHYMEIIRHTWMYDLIVVDFPKECKRLFTFAKGVSRADVGPGAPKTHHRIAKQVDALGEELKRKLKGFLYEKLVAARHVRYELFQNVDWVARVNIARDAPGLDGWRLCKSLVKMLKYALEHLNDLDTFFMDAYLLGRMLYNAEPSRVPKRRSAVAIAYTGYYHTATYNDFFKHSLGARQLGRSKHAQLELREVGETLPMRKFGSGDPIYVVGDVAYAKYGVSFAIDYSKRFDRPWNFRLTPAELLELRTFSDRTHGGFQLQLNPLDSAVITLVINKSRALAKHARSSGPLEGGTISQGQGDRAMLFGMPFSSSNNAEDGEEGEGGSAGMDLEKSGESPDVSVVHPEVQRTKEPSKSNQMLITPIASASVTTPDGDPLEEFDVDLNVDGEETLDLGVPSAEEKGEGKKGEENENIETVGSKNRGGVGFPLRKLMFPCANCEARNVSIEYVCKRCRLFGACSASCAQTFLRLHERICWRYFGDFTDL